MLRDQVWHPNIDLNGNICLNILYLPPKGEWTPVLDVEAVYYGLVFLFAVSASWPPSRLDRRTHCCRRFPLACVCSLSL